MVDSCKTAKTFRQSVYFNYVALTIIRFFVQKSRRTKDVCKLFQNTVGSINTTYPPFIDESDTVALTCLVNNWSRRDNGNALFPETAKHFPKLLTRDRVYTGSRFIQKKNIRFMDKRATKSKFLLHTTGQSPRTTIAKRFYLPVDVAYQIIIFLNGGMENRSKEIQVFFYRQILIEREPSGHISYPLTNSFIVLRRIQSANRSCAFIGKQQSGENTEQGCLPRTVRTDDAEKFTPLDRQ